MYPQTSVQPHGHSLPSGRALISSYLELSKARLATLVVLTAVVGYLLAARGAAGPWPLVWLAVGTALSAFGANILNQLIEEDRDRRMLRTRNRPLPSGRVERPVAAVWGIGSALVGVSVLAIAANWLTAGLSLGVILLYVVVYTPLKVVTTLNTVVGAICGAVPPMMGWTAAIGRLELGAWILFGILFIWQMPHFLSLAWLYRDDYRRAGFRMLPTVDRAGSVTARIALLHAAALLPVTASLWWGGVTGTTFLIASQLLGIAFAAVGWHFFRVRTDHSARRLFLASIAYLPLLLACMVFDADNRIPRLGQQAPITAATSAPDRPEVARLSVTP